MPDNVPTDDQRIIRKAKTVAKGEKRALGKWVLLYFPRPPLRPILVLSPYLPLSFLSWEKISPESSTSCGLCAAQTFSFLSFQFGKWQPSCTHEKQARHSSVGNEEIAFPLALCTLCPDIKKMVHYKAIVYCCCNWHLVLLSTHSPIQSCSKNSQMSVPEEKKKKSMSLSFSGTEKKLWADQNDHDCVKCHLMRSSPLFSVQQCAKNASQSE